MCGNNTHRKQTSPQELVFNLLSQGFDINNVKTMAESVFPDCLVTCFEDRTFLIKTKARAKSK